MSGIPDILVIALAVAAGLLVAMVLGVRARRRRDASPALPGRTASQSPNALTCPFCKREYDPAETGGRCPGCGAAAPKRP